jgi:hypothetical protein
MEHVLFVTTMSQAYACGIDRHLAMTKKIKNRPCHLLKTLFLTNIFLQIIRYLAWADPDWAGLDICNKQRFLSGCAQGIFIFLELMILGRSHDVPPYFSKI